MIYTVIAYIDSLLDRLIIRIDIDRYVNWIKVHAKNIILKRMIWSMIMASRIRLQKNKFFWGFFYCTKQGYGSVKLPKKKVFPCFLDSLDKISP